MDKKVKIALEKFKKQKSAWADIYASALEDLEFLSDKDDAQWDSSLYAERLNSGRPVVSIDQLSQFIQQTANDIRANTPSIVIIPSDGGDEKVAEILSGLIKDIEYKSSADNAYDYGSECSIKCSIGFLRVTNEFDTQDDFKQALRIERVIDPLSVYLDSASVRVDGSDAKFCFIVEQITIDEFKSRYPNFAPVCFDSEKDLSNQKGVENITIAEYFYVEESNRKIALTEDGSTKEIEDESENENEYKAVRSDGKRKVMRCVLSGADVLEETEFPGEYIPVVPIYGKEMWVKGKRYLHSLIRKSKQPQQLLNLWKSIETEVLLMQPKAWVMAAEGVIDDYSEEWQNPDRASALRYKQTDIDGNPAPAPQRLSPPVMPSGVVNAAAMVVDDIKATMGIYNAALGQRSNETSGIAINQRKIEGDIATYHFGDNLVKSITHVGRILVSAIPYVYSESRIIRIIGKEDEPKKVGINGAIVEGQERDYDLTQGKYDVRVVTGSSFTTKRQESAQFFNDIVKSSPDLMMVMGDLLFKYMDVPGASAMSARMKKVVDPKFFEEDEEGNAEIIKLKQQFDQSQTVIQQLQEALQQKEQNADVELKLEIMKVQSDAQKAQADTEIKQGELQIKAAELELKKAELDLRRLELMKQVQEQVLMPQQPTFDEDQGY